MTRTVCGRCEMDKCQCKTIGAPEMTRDDIIRMAYKVSDGVLSYDAEGRWILSEQEVIQLAALVAAAEQKPISDVTEAVTKTVIETEKLLCEKIGRQWQPSGMSIRTLVDELAALVAEREREACAKVCEETRFPDSYTAIRCAAAIRSRGEP